MGRRYSFENSGLEFVNFNWYCKGAFLGWDHPSWDLGLGSPNLGLRSLISSVKGCCWSPSVGVSPPPQMPALWRKGSSQGATPATEPALPWSISMCFEHSPKAGVFTKALASVPANPSLRLLLLRASTWNMCKTLMCVVPSAELFVDS